MSDARYDAIVAGVGGMGSAAVYELARREQDAAKRFALYQAMDRIVVRESPVVALYYDEVVRLTQNNVLGLTPNPMNQLLLERVRKE